MSEKFDLIVLGGGSGGLAHAQRATEYSAKVLVIEPNPLGGTCVNAGCIPKKIMWYASNIVHQIELAEGYGFDLSIKSHDWKSLRDHRSSYIKRLNELYEKNLMNKKICLVKDCASFINPNTVRVGDKTYQAKHIVIATGGKPIIPQLKGAELGITSDDFFELSKKPKRVAIIGSGYIAVELTGIFAALGSEVSIFVRKNSILRNFDSMLRDELTHSLKQQNIGLHTEVLLRELYENTSGVDTGKTVIGLKSEGGENFSSFDCVIWAVGRSPNTKFLNLDSIQVETDEKGFIKVDKYQKTNIDNIYAIGDVTGKNALTPVAIAAGRRLADRLFGEMLDRHLEYRTIPSVVFSHPPIGTVGLTEEEARSQYGDDVQVFTSKFTSLVYALSKKKSLSSMKLVTLGDDQKIIGCHIIGDGADEILQGFAVAIRNGATKTDFDDTVAIHPTSAEELVTMR